MNHTMAYDAPFVLTYHTAYGWRHSAANGDQIAQWTVATSVHISAYLSFSQKDDECYQRDESHQHTHRIQQTLLLAIDRILVQLFQFLHSEFQTQGTKYPLAVSFSPKPSAPRSRRGRGEILQAETRRRRRLFHSIIKF